MYNAGARAVSGPDLPGCGPLQSGEPGRASGLRQQVFVYVRARGQASRADIARGLGISAGSVTALTSDLIQAGFLEEIDDQPRETGRGRPPVALRVVGGSRCVIGIKVADTRHSAVLTDFAGQMIADVTLPTPQARKPAAALVAELAVLVDRLLADAGYDLDSVAGVGLGISGIVEHDAGQVP
ncbi:MAG: hypothetical protein ACI9U6_003450, partial [Loktanella salsilacus]